jgi:MFS family permease
LSILFCFAPFSAAVIFSNALRGIGWSSMAASGYTLLAAAPPERRGEASGYFGGVQSSATIIFPALSLWILDAPFGGFGAGLFCHDLGPGRRNRRLGPVPRHATRPIPTKLDASEPWWREIVNVVDRHILTAALLIHVEHVTALFFQLRGALCAPTRRQPFRLVLRRRRRNQPARGQSSADFPIGSARDVHS